MTLLLRLRTSTAALARTATTLGTPSTAKVGSGTRRAHIHRRTTAALESTAVHVRRRTTAALESTAVHVGRRATTALESTTARCWMPTEAHVRGRMAIHVRRRTIAALKPTAGGRMSTAADIRH